MKGYFRRPEENEKVFAWDGERLWLKTGDLAYRDEGGRFYIVGRRKEMFISAGRTSTRWRWSGPFTTTRR
jgi:fatty-acyl-CoA synthase